MKLGVTRNSSIIGWQDDNAMYSHILQQRINYWWAFHAYRRIWRW